MSAQTETINALKEACESLLTISRLAGRDEFLDSWQNIRAYANNRGNVAAEAINKADKTDPEAEPILYLCPAGCGCTWRDNHDGTMSLFGENSKSCEICERLPLSRMTRLYTSPLKWEVIDEYTGDYPE